MRELTPYDTGERLEPKLWVLPESNRPHEDYGKVDFENDESVTEAMIYVERAKDGRLDVQVYNHGSDPLRVFVEEDVAEQHLTLGDKLRARLRDYDNTLATPGQAQDIAEADLLHDVEQIIRDTEKAWETQ
jgi:hypothetical protein